MRGGGVNNLSLNAVNPTDSQKLAKSKATRLSLICFFALSSMAAASTPTIPTNDPNKLNITNGRNVDRTIWAAGSKSGDVTDQNGWNQYGGDLSTMNANKYPNTLDYFSVAYKYSSLPKINLFMREGMTINYLAVNYKKVSGNTPWQDMSAKAMNTSGVGNTNLKIGTFDVIGDVKFEIELAGTSNITTLNNEAERLNIKVYNENNDKLNIDTLNQTTANGDSQIFKNVSVDTFNLHSGKSYQRGGRVGTLNLQGGEYHLGATDGIAAAEEAGTIGNLVLAEGTFKQYKGEIHNISLTADKKEAHFTTSNSFKNGSQGTYNGLITQIDKTANGTNTVTFGNSGGTITSTVTKGLLTIDNKNGDITNYGEVSSLDVSNKVGSAVVNNNAIINTLTSNNNSTINNLGKITTLDFKGGSVSNKGEITNLNLTSANATLHNSGVITNLISGTTTKAFRATANKHISNAGTIDKLELNEATNVTNSGTIKELNVNKGNSTINTLTGVAQNPDTKLSSINIKQSAAKLTVDTLRVGLDGNNAIKRVEINGNTGSNGGGKEFAVNKIQVSYINGTFDPTQNISNQLKDYVSNGVSQSYIDGNSKPTFEASPELEGGPGIKFNPDGTPHFDPQDSISASMTSMILRQSLRRKMLLDTYLAEQSRRSLKNKERRTRQRLEKATLGEARAKYEADLAVYNRLKMEWDKLANTKQNKAIIAKYEKDEKDYQKALKQYEQDYKQYEQESKKLEELAKATNIKIPVEPKAPIRPNVKPNDKNYKKLMSAYEKEEKAYQKALKKYEEDYKRYDQKIKRFEILARVSNLKAPVAPKKPNVKPNDKNYKKLMAGYEKARKDYQQSLKTYEQEKKNLEVLAKAHKIDIKIPVEPKAPIKPDVKPSDKDYKKLMVAYEKEQKAYQKALKQYEQDYKQYEQESKKLEELANAQKAKTKAPVEPKAPAIPAILASKPIAPIEPKLGEVSAELVAEHEVKGDFFVRAYGGTGTHSLNNGAQTTSWSAGTLLGANWNLALGQTSGNIGFYGGYEYIHNGYEQAHINAQGHNGFVGLRFSHLFVKTKLAGFYYIADVNGGYTNIDVSQSMNNMLYSANVGNINIGASFRLASAVYMYGSKSILFPSLGVGVDGGYLGEFEMKTNKAGELRYGGLGQPYAVTYAQANLNYYQEWGKRFSTTLGGGIRYLLNNDVSIMPTLNGKTYRIDEQTGKVASAHLAPFFYQGTFMVNYHTDNAGNLSAGYVAVGGEKGLTHNISARWHYFF